MAPYGERMKGKTLMLLDRIERSAVWAVLAVALAIVASAWFSVPVRPDDPRTPLAISQLKQ